MNPQQQILIVDDDSRNRQILTIMLADDYVTREAVSGEEALAALDSFKPDIVLLDIMMPGIDGYEVCRKLRKNAMLAGVKVLLITAKGSLEDRLKGYEVGADDFIVKPFDEEELLAKITVFARLNEAEKKTRQLNQRLLLRQQDIPNILWECDNDLRFTWIEDSASLILGYSPDDMIGKPMADYLVPENVGEFYFKFRQDTNQVSHKVSGLPFVFICSDGSQQTLQVFADADLDGQDKTTGMTGIFRDISAFSSLLERDSDDTSDQQMTIRVDQDCRLVYVAPSVSRYLPEGNYDPADPPDFKQFLTDPSVATLFEFSFDQKEDVPFPVELKLTNGEGVEHGFSVTFFFSPDGPCQEGVLSPIGVDDQLDLVSQKMEKRGKTIEDQEAVLKNAVIIDSDMQESILTDAQNLSSEILDLVKNLESFAFPDEGSFDLEEYGQFLFNRNLQIYSENIRLLGNKIHGLKGSCGFLMQPAKDLCHHMEDVTRPLAENKLVLTQSISGLIKQFIFRIEEMLDQFAADPKAEPGLDNWLDRIDSTIEKATIFINDKAQSLDQLIKERCVDNGEFRQRKKDEYLSVSLDGYEELAERVQELFYTLSSSLSSEELMEASAVYNDFLSTHQQIKKVPLNLSRYERLIPKLAQDYEKEADFYFKDHQVKADREFWNAIHEILNHVLKNAVIHGIESAAERRSCGKDAAGKITVDLKEDAMHVLLTVSDDGRGIDSKKLAEKVVAEGILDIEKLGQMTEDDILQLLFLQGVSTVESLDDNAGRGIGMNAVQEAVHQLQGKCRIINDPGKGCSYKFSFQKNNVSLPCIVVGIGDLALAFPEAYVESFVDYREEDIVTIKQQLSYRHNDSLIPLVDAGTIFERDAIGMDKAAVSVMVIKNEGERHGLVINEILHHANMPILPLPKLYKDVPIYQGITIYNTNPIQVVNVGSLT